MPPARAGRVDLALGADDVVYVINRSYENRPDGIHVTMCTLNEEYITEFGSAGEGDGHVTAGGDVAGVGDGEISRREEDHERRPSSEAERDVLGNQAEDPVPG